MTVICGINVVYLGDIQKENSYRIMLFVLICSSDSLIVESLSEGHCELSCCGIPVVMIAHVGCIATNSSNGPHLYYNYYYYFCIIIIIIITFSNPYSSSVAILQDFRLLIVDPLCSMIVLRIFSCSEARPGGRATKLSFPPRMIPLNHLSSSILSPGYKIQSKTLNRSRVNLHFQQL